MNPKIEEILKTEWPSAKRHLESPPEVIPGQPPVIKESKYWSRQLTPGFPAEWPLSRNGELIFYAFAYGSHPSALVDGHWVTAPWARFVVTLHDDNVRFEQLGQSPRILTQTQGVRPLLPEENLISRESGAVFEEFADVLRRNGEITPGALVEKVKRSYRFWASCHGLAAREIRPLHAAFFEWMNLG